VPAKDHLAGRGSGTKRTLPARPVGIPDPEQAASIEEAFFAYRSLFTALAQRQPLVLILEDVHWAESTLLDLIEHVVEWTRDAPLQIVCLARPELLDQRPGWSGERLPLDRLREEDAAALVATLAPGIDTAVRARATEVADGNPLFLEQLLALAKEDGGEPAVPHTIQALLAVRLDHLAPDERSLIEGAAVIGEEFWRSALVALSPPNTEVSVLIQRLIRRQLIRPARSSLPEEDAFEFGHVLIRDTTYYAISKEIRARLHERFADWLQAHGRAYEEIIGYHLEQAYHLRTDLGLVDAAGRALAMRATEELATAALSCTADQRYAPALGAWSPRRSWAG
jgi:predicted ATPase